MYSLPASSVLGSQGSVGFIGLNRSTVTLAYHHSLTVREYPPHWLPLSPPPNISQFGAEGGTRTHMVSQPPEPKSGAYTNFATSA